jgi:hypothetical protein
MLPWMRLRAAPCIRRLVRRRLIALAAVPLLAAACGGSSGGAPRGIALRAGDAPPGFTLLTKTPYAPFARIPDDPRRKSTQLTRLVGDAWLGGFTTTFGGRDRVVQTSVDVFRARLGKLARPWAQAVMEQWRLSDRKLEAPPAEAPGSWHLLVVGRMRTPLYRSHPAGRHAAAFYFWRRGRLLGTLVAWSTVPGGLAPSERLLMTFARRQDAKFRAAGE